MVSGKKNPRKNGSQKNDPRKNDILDILVNSKT